ncbi:hypothetical protein IEO21_04910 [Rhodonia placenta]|uniref:Uncharacterized protein n=1 Tax=Rhodonia placenta TaxID=104341 RepID=A0A8H7U2S3_9APHY|nr:hypothetical protein IEO21_04910 [Postia placenta]
MLSACALSGEPLIQSMSPTVDAHAYALDEPFARTVVGERRHLSAYEARTIPRLWQLHKEKRALRKSHLDHWEATAARTGTGRAVDAIISPVEPYAACPHGCNSDAFYTTLCNVLDYAAVVFPVTHVDGARDAAQPPHAFRNQEDAAVYEMCESSCGFSLRVGSGARTVALITDRAHAGGRGGPGDGGGGGRGAEGGAVDLIRAVLYSKIKGGHNDIKDTMYAAGMTQYYRMWNTRARQRIGGSFVTRRMSGNLAVLPSSRSGSL